MADTAQASDMSLGLSLALGVITLLATLGMLASSYPGVIDGEGAQVITGLSFAAAMLAGGLAVAAVHIFAE